MGKNNDADQLLAEAEEALALAVQEAEAMVAATPGVVAAQQKRAARITEAQAKVAQLRAEAAKVAAAHHLAEARKLGGRIRELDRKSVVLVCEGLRLRYQASELRRQQQAAVSVHKAKCSEAGIGTSIDTVERDGGERLGRGTVHLAEVWRRPTRSRVYNLLVTLRSEAGIDEIDAEL